MEDEAPAGAPEWVVTYGDMMSLLLTFFIMLVSLSDVNATAKYRAVMEAIQRRLGYYSGTAGPRGMSLPLNSLIQRMGSLGALAPSQKGKGGVRAQGPAGNDYRVLRRRDGMSVLIGGPLTFTAGSGELSPALEAALDRIVVVLAGKPNRIEIRSHVAVRAPDAAAVLEAYMLEFQRARSILSHLEQRGIEPRRMRIVTMGAAKMPDERGDLQGDRVEILVLDTRIGDQ